MQRGIVIAGAALLLGAATMSLRAQTAAADPQAVTFVVMGDPQPEEPPTEEPAVFRRILGEIDVLRPACALVVGDLIRGFTDDSLLLAREWDGFEQAVRASRVPLLCAPGNHDVWNVQSEKEFARRFGRLYGSTDVGPVHLILLDSYVTGEFNAITGKQREWLAADLEQHRDAQHVFVGVHAPLWAYGDASNWMKEIHPLLRRYNVRAVFAGHWHIYQRSDITDGIRYFVTGGAGGQLGDGSAATGEIHHYMHVSVRGDDVTYGVIVPGSVLPESTITKESSARAFALTERAVSDPLLTCTGSVLVQDTIAITVANIFADSLRYDLSWHMSRPVLRLDSYDRTNVVGPRERRVETFRVVDGAAVVPEVLIRDRPWLDVAVALPGRRYELRKDLLIARRAPTVPLPGGVAIDGECREWGNAFPVRIDARSQVSLLPERWTGPSESSGKFAVAVNDSALYFAGEVVDPWVTRAARKEEPYQADAVSLYLDLRTGEEFQRRSIGPGIVLIVFAPPSDKGEEAYWLGVYPFDRQIRGVRFASRRTGEGYTVEASIPFDALGRVLHAGDTVGLDVCIDNLEASGNRTRMLWNGIWGNFMTAHRYGRLEIGSP
jgi:hypothetical protein